MTKACYKNSNNNNEFDNSENKVCLLLKRWVMVDHVLDHVLDHMLDHMLRLHAKSHDHKICNHGDICNLNFLSCVYYYF